MGNCKSKQLGAETREGGLCVIEVIKCEHLPNMDVITLTDTYVKVCFKDITTSTSAIVGTSTSTTAAKDDVQVTKVQIHNDSNVLQTMTQWNSLNPVFNSFLAFPFYPSESDKIEFTLKDEDTVSGDDMIGNAEINFKSVASRLGEEIKVAVDLKKGLKVEGDKLPSIIFRLVKLERKLPPTLQQPEKITKVFFIIRHGESVWNESQEKMNVKGLVSQYDHELTKLGIEQAQNFNKRWNESLSSKFVDREEEVAKSKGDNDIDDFLSATKIFSSPLTRAVETALLTCKGHPILKTESMMLLRNLREVKNFGSFDTVGKHIGEDIEINVREKLIRDVGGALANELLQVKLDPHDAIDSWWTPLEEKENKNDVYRRFTDLWAFLRFGTEAKTSILVGHSHFFRHMLHEHMSAEFRKREPEWTSTLDKSKLDNGACMRLEVEWDASKDPMAHPVIHSAKLVFGSKLHGLEPGELLISEKSISAAEMGNSA